VTGGKNNAPMPAVARDELEDLFARLEMARKIRFAEALGLVDARDVAFLGGISKIRNHVVHNVKNVDFDLKAYFAAKNAADTRARTAEV
jgi:hypothetical protein